MDEVLRFDNKSSETKTKHKSKRRCRRHANDATENAAAADLAADDDVYHPVICTVCNSEVGVFDKDEVYHFFNVLASYA